MFSSDQRKLLNAVRDCAQSEGLPVFLVGGLVRDLLQLLGSSDQKNKGPGGGSLPHASDFDFVVAGRADRLAENFALRCGGSLRKFREFLTLKVERPFAFSSIGAVDFAGIRRESYPQPGGLPEVSEAGSLEDDLRRRDFTVNAMALSVTDLIAWLDSAEHGLSGLSRLVLDPLGGREDLANRLIRILHPLSFRDDPTRIFRAARYAVRIGGRLEDGTENLAREAVAGGALDTVSLFRIVTEVRKICAEGDWLAVFEALRRQEVFAHLAFFKPVPEEDFFRLLSLLKHSELAGRREAFELFMGALICFVQEDQAARIFNESGLGRRKLNQIMPLKRVIISLRNPGST